MAPWLFQILLIGIVLFALWRGGRDERLVAALCLIGTTTTAFVLAPIHERYQDVELGVFAVDLVLLGGFLVVALRSCRFWPLWVAALQLTTTLGHLLKGLDATLIPKAYAASLSFWGYPILIILLIGTWRTYRRQQSESGRQACPS